MEKKVNMKFPHLPEKIKTSNFIKSIYFDLVDEKAQTIIAKKVSKMNGDLRVAFDIIKSCFVDLHKKVHLD